MHKLTVEELYGKENANAQHERYLQTKKCFEDTFGYEPGLYFSAPGRTEIGGNHTDHNNGLVLAASVSCDMAAAVSKRDDGIIRVRSQGFDRTEEVDTSSIEMIPAEKGTSAALIKGVAAGLKNGGHCIGGFDAYIVSDVLQGSGLSSSAAYEVLIGTILNGLYNSGEVGDIETAKISQFAENVYFGKPSGLMDQMACSVGGSVMIDFEDVSEPKVERIDVELEKYGYCLCIVDTGGSHADLTEDYASIPPEMKSVAEYFGKNVLREISREQVMESIEDIRRKCGDRALLRAMHFFDENERVICQAQALKQGRFDDFLALVNASGDSSLAYLQNIFSASGKKEQGLTLALYLAKKILGKKGACRVHGGGFAGTIQAIVPLEMTDRFKEQTEKVFGSGRCHIFSIRKYGGTQVRLQV